MIKPAESHPKKRTVVPLPSFDPSPHFTSTPGAMQMVDTEAQAKKGGVRMWVKGKLENFVRR